MSEHESPKPDAKPDAKAGKSPEDVIWEGPLSQWQNLGWFISCILILPIPIAFWKWLSTKNYVVRLTRQRLRIRHGVISKHNEDVELYRVKDWTLQEPLLQRIFGTGKVQIISSDRTAPELTLEWVPKPVEFVEDLREAVEDARDLKRVRHLEGGFGESGDSVDMD